MTFQDLKAMSQYIDHGIEVLSHVGAGDFVAPTDPVGSAEFYESLQKNIEQQRKDFEHIQSDFERLSELPAVFRDSVLIYQKLKQQIQFIQMQTSPDVLPFDSLTSSPVRQPTNPVPISPGIPIQEVREHKYKEISEAEYMTLPNITRLLIKLPELNDLYQKLAENFEDEFTNDDITDITQLRLTRLDALIHALKDCKRITVDTQDGEPIYSLISQLY